MVGGLPLRLVDGEQLPEAINGRLEHLRGIALGIRNFTHYALLSVIHFGQLAARTSAL